MKHLHASIITVVILAAVSQALADEVINDRLSLVDKKTAFSPTAVSGGPAGTFTITATFKNISNDPITGILFRVATLTGGNLLLNRTGGTGGVGSTLIVSFSGDYSDRVLNSGESLRLQFIIGLAARARFQFFVDAFSASFVEPVLGVSFSYPDFGQPSQVEQILLDSDDIEFVVDLPSQSDGSLAGQFSILVFDNLNNLSLEDWFLKNVDPSGILLTAGAFQGEILPSGIEALLFNGPLPSQYQDGPVAQIYARSVTGESIIVISQLQDNDLGFYGLSPEDQLPFLKDIVETVVAP
jgi:hypothetical protein